MAVCEREPCASVRWVTTTYKNPMLFVLPQEARNHFDKEADSLVASLKPLPNRPPSRRRQGSDAHVPLVRTLTEKDLLGRPRVSVRDWLGRLKAVEVHGEVAGQQIHEVLPEAGTEALERLADSLARHRSLRTCCGVAYIRKHLIDWMQRRRLRETADGSWTADLLAALERDVQEQTILVPLEGIAIAEPFELGQLAFNFFTEASIHAMVPPEAGAVAPPEVVEEFRGMLKERFQGHVYAQYTCIAEEEHAQELAVRQTDAVLEILRMFDAAALDIRARCLMGRMGQVAPAERHLLRVGVPDRLLLAEGLDHDGVVRFALDREILDVLHGSGFGVASQLLSKEEQTDLEKHSLEAISHYAHGVASPAPQDRLLHALVAVESLLIRDQNEPVQGKLGQRMALLTASDLASRKQAVKRLQAGYGLRSAFVHHGIKPGDIKQANEVLLLCWETLNAVALNTQRFNSRQALLDSLDDALLS